MVAFGDPIISPEPGLLPDESQDPVRQAQLLPFSAEEIRSIAKMASGRSELFLGKNNLKRSFLSGRANSALLLHVSTHAFSDADNPEESRMLFSPDKAEDGADYVFLRELYDLDLSNVRLATISACDTERGNIVRGEGVQAFSRALLSAGSRSSLTVLWRVEDQATAEFMRQFYFFALQQHKPTAEALRLAKLKFLSSNTRLQNPRYWAGFVLNGDGFAELPRILSWTWLVILGCGVLAVAALATAVLTLRVGRRFDR